MAAKRTGVLELAVLGLLHEGPMHGYELRKRINLLLGTFRAFSYGSLYPALRTMLEAGWIAQESPDDPDAAPATAGKRARIVYKITAEGKEEFQHLLADAGPDAWEDERFGVHLAFFSHADAATRLRVLEGRRSRLEERREKFRTSLVRTRERLDTYTLALQNHGLDSVEREVRWLGELIDDERAIGSSAPRAPRAAHDNDNDVAGPSGTQQP
ncbi:DNA-binding PadR family transcriptional regulator [Motilibacter peucedani]|uniref:DNA-binding PadR family transcriptional regulator n=1 Tax=Motilibacter peucedani TaxID=598650 RepID=A0A420XU64_9ACTN|nr:PadR family transcriptional regulator [Motilibacter peucedani]RKS80383.1 DNA-binding PadR family transcriptional regulator [Motilibacter peucedani]